MSDSVNDLPMPGKVVADVEREPINWLFNLMLARGKLTILDGEPGMGKGVIYAELAACATTARDFSGGEIQFSGEPTSVVIVTTEDGIADTIRPRLEAAGANLARVRVIETVPAYAKDGGVVERVPRIPDDLPQIFRAVEEDGAGLLIIDPLFAHLDKSQTNSFRDQDVRAALGPLGVEAGRHECAVLIVRHLNKAEGLKAINRGGGSIGVIGAARIGLMVGDDPVNKGRRVLACVKTNIGRYPPSLAYTVASAPDDPEVPVLQWHGRTTLTADALVAPKKRGPKPEAREEAAAFLRDALADGPRPSLELIEEGAEHGHAQSTLRRALKEIGGDARKVGFGKDGGWEWTLSHSGVDGADGATTDCSAISETCSSMDKPGNLCEREEVAASKMVKFSGYLDARDVEEERGHAA